MSGLSQFVVTVPSITVYSFQKLLGHQMAEFKITMKCMWSKDGKFQKFGNSEKKKTPKSQEELVDVDMKNGDVTMDTGVEVDIGNENIIQTHEP
jgi:hypothetical protein